VAVAAVCLLTASSCSSPRNDAAPASTLTEHQRDSVLARSALPGAGVVGRAMAESQRAATQAARMDSLIH
jgi:hypothetical protein